MLALRSDCLLIASRWLSHDLRVPLRAIALESYPAPLILITSKDADNARSALNTGATNIIWLSEVHRDLHTLVCGTRARQVLNRAANLIEGSSRLNPRLRAALAYACRAAREPSCTRPSQINGGAETLGSLVRRDTGAHSSRNSRRRIANGLEASEIPRAPRQVAPRSSISMRQSRSKVGIVGSTGERTRTMPNPSSTVTAPRPTFRPLYRSSVAFGITSPGGSDGRHH
jgi:hypothetical protein